MGKFRGQNAPPPSFTTHLHMPQEPLPPQADGRKISLFPRADKSEGVPVTVRLVSVFPLMVMLFSPVEETLASTNKSIPTNSRITMEKTIRLTR